MKLAIIHEGRVHQETDTATAAMKLPGGRPVFDVRDVSHVPGIASGWLANADGTYTPACWPKPRFSLLRLLRLRSWRFRTLAFPGAAR